MRFRKALKPKDAGLGAGSVAAMAGARDPRAQQRPARRAGMFGEAFSA